MGINVASSFTMNAALPLDDRTKVADIAARNAILSGRRYEGLIVYVIAEQTNYQLIGGITDGDWEELSGSGGGSGTSDESEKVLLTNNSVNNITDIGEYLSDCVCIIVDYYLYRRTDSGSKRMTGRIVIEANEDGATNPDKWALIDSIRSEYGDPSGVTFSLDDIDTEKSILVATLDDYTGANHSCSFHYKLTKLLTATSNTVLVNNTSTNLTSIGDYLVNSMAIMVDYYIYRRTDSGYKSISGKIFLEGNPEGATNPDKWALFEAERSENGGASGITFSLDDIDTEKSILVATLDNMAGANHSCIMYYKTTELTA
jgi:hypothetical protein